MGGADGQGTRRRRNRIRRRKPKRRRLNADSRRHRRVASADQRRRPFARADGDRGRPPRRRDRVFSPRRAFSRSRCRPIPRSSWRSPPGARIARRIEASGARRTSISRPRGRSASPRAHYCLQARHALHDRAITRAFPNISRRARRIPERWTYAVAAPLPRALRRRAWCRRRRSAQELVARGFAALVNLVARRRHRDASVRGSTSVLDLPRPIFLYVGRVAVEKNLAAFLDARSAGLEGDRRRRPARAGARSANIRTRISSAAQSGERLWRSSTRAPTSSSSRAAPTRSASSCSRRWPAACRSPAYPVPGPLDVIGDSGAGVARRGPARGMPGGARAFRARRRAPTPCNSPGRESARQFLDNIEESRAQRVAPAKELELVD